MFSITLDRRHPLPRSPNRPRPRLAHRGRAARASASSARTAPGRRRCSACSPGSTRPTAARSCATRPGFASATCRRSSTRGRRRRCSSTSRGGPAWRRPSRSWTRSPRGSRRARGSRRRYSDALDRYLALGGGDLQARAGAVCAELGLARRLGQPLATLSGGQAARARLAALLLSRFEVLCLDEPTNDLDFEGLDRLERFVAGLRGSLVVVSHDRAFLDRAVTRIVEVDEWTGGLVEFAGGWSDYEAAPGACPGGAVPGVRADGGAAARARGARARAPGQRQSGAALGNARAEPTVGRRTRSSTKVRQAQRALERLDRVDKPYEPWQLQLSLAPGSRGATVVARLEGAVVERGEFRLGPVDLELHAGDRLAVVRAQRLREVDAAGGAARDGAARRGPAVARARRRRRGARPAAAPLRGRRAAGAARSRAEAGLPTRGGADAAREVRARRGGRRAARRDAVAGRADARGAGAARCARREPARARRADEPPRPAGDRGARGGARGLLGHRRPGHPRPPAARAVQRDATSSTSTPAGTPAGRSRTAGPTARRLPRGQASTPP